MRKIITKRILIVFGIMIVVFGMINLAWFILIKWPYDHYCERSQAFCTSSAYTENEMIEMSYNTYHDTDNSYGYKIYKPGYLYFGGLTLAIGDDRHTTATYDPETGEFTDEDPPILIINVVRDAFGQFKYALMVVSNSAGIYDVLIDRELNIIEASAEQSEKAKEIIDENHAHLEEIMSYAQNMWELE